MNAGIIILVIILFLFLIFSIVFMIIGRNNLNMCINSESGVCPSYYCNYNSVSKTGGSPCIQLLKSKDDYGNDVAGPDVAFRFDKKGNIMCQKFTLPENVLSPWTCTTANGCIKV